MAKAGRNNDMLTDRNSVGNQDIESGCITEQVWNIRNKMEGSANNDGHIDDIDKWVASLQGLLEDVPQYMRTRGHPGRISKIPEILREVDVKGYEPYIMSVGPYHHGRSRVERMERKKKLVLNCVLDNKPELTLKDYLKEIAIIEPTARSFYSDIQMDSESFVHMLLLDSVYLVTMFCGMPKSHERMNETETRDERKVDNEDANGGEEREIKDKGDINGSANLKITAVADELSQVKSGDHWYWTWFAHDLFLLENQLPFFLLQKIHNLIFDDSEKQFIDIVKSAFTYMLTDYTKLDSEMVISRAEEVHHMLHLCHMFFRPTIQQESNACHFPDSSQMFRLGSAMQLYRAGVHFEARSASTEYSLLDITFDGSGKMEMTCLHVDDNTESLLRNLIALEQMKYPRLGLNISAYVVLLLHLITTPKDVELLRGKGIIQHHLASDKEMMYLVNRLSTGLAFDYAEDQYSLKPLFQELKHYSERRVPRWRAWLKHRHFSNPWTTISLLVASLLLLLTAVQAYYTVYSYYYPCCDGHLGSP